MTHGNKTVAGLILASILASLGGVQTASPRQNPDDRFQSSQQSSDWESPARLRNNVGGGTSGTLRANSRGVEFVPLKGASKRWAFTEIKDLDLQRRRVVLVGYDSRGWLLPGTQRFDFEVRDEITPVVAALLTQEMRRPIRNRVPNPDAPAITEIAVRRSDHFEASNGLLRIRQQGIDYITAQSGQSRSWRWVDLQTLSNPDPYHFFVSGYRDSYAFDLKTTLARELFNHLEDQIWTHNEGETRSDPVPLPASTPTNGGRIEHE